MTDHTGRKVRQLRESLGVSGATLSELIGVNSSGWSYWERNGCPPERMQEIAALTKNPEETLDWLAHPTKAMPNIELKKPIPGGKTTVKKTKNGSRRTFSNQQRANILWEVERLKEQEGLNFEEAAQRVGVHNSNLRTWMKMPSLPPANFAPTPGVSRDAQVAALQARRGMTVEDAAENIKAASAHTNLPQQPVPKKKAGMTSAADKLTPMPVLVMRYQCPRCGQNLILEEE